VSPSVGHSLVLIAAGLLAPLGGLAAERFAPADILDWEPHSFAGSTRYELTETSGGEAVHAYCEGGSASGLFYRGEIDLSQTPVVEWRWRAGEQPEGVDERSKAGDDFAARLYAVDEHTILRWRTRALNYVWSAGEPVGSDWPNPFASQARMIAVASGEPHGEGWVVQRRNLREDFQRYHDRDLESLDALAIMTDCDNTGQPTEAWYGGIRLLPAGAE